MCCQLELATNKKNSITVKRSCPSLFDCCRKGLLTGSPDLFNLTKEVYEL
jgi:hypothetical protein